MKDENKTKAELKIELREGREFLKKLSIHPYHHQSSIPNRKTILNDQPINLIKDF